MTVRGKEEAREGPVSRRRLLGRLARAGAVGAGAAVLGGGVMAEPALAGTDGDVVLGLGDQSTTGITGVLSSAFYGFVGKSTAAGGVGLLGYGGIGVSGIGKTFGIAGRGDVSPNSVGVFGQGELNGVEGHSSNNLASGVYGENGSGFGVAGRADGGVGVLGDSANGIGVHANSTSGTALSVDGKARFSRSGAKGFAGTVGAPKSSATISNVSLTPSSVIIATPQNNIPGVWVQAAVPNVPAHSITIHLSQAVTEKYVVGWMVIEHP